jgi:hypothetical protein
MAGLIFDIESGIATAFAARARRFHLGASRSRTPPQRPRCDGVGRPFPHVSCAPGVQCAQGKLGDYEELHEIIKQPGRQIERIFRRDVCARGAVNSGRRPYCLGRIACRSA